MSDDEFEISESTTAEVDEEDEDEADEYEFHLDYVFPITAHRQKYIMQVKDYEHN